MNLNQGRLEQQSQLDRRSTQMFALSALMKTKSYSIDSILGDSLRHSTLVSSSSTQAPTTGEQKSNCITVYVRHRLL